MDSDFLSPSPFTPSWGRGNENKYFIYNGESMAPLFKPGDMLCVNISSLLDIHLGDIIVYHMKTEANEPLSVVHRVISAKKDELITKGDNNANQDTQVVTKKNLVGLVTSYERRGRLYPVRGGTWGLFHAGMTHVRNLLLILIKRLGWWAYHPIKQSGLVARMWQPDIIQIRVKTNSGPLIKYCYGNRTVAHWWPQQKQFDVVKPFDLVISPPEDWQ
jgi:signal peptidase I